MVGLQVTAELELVTVYRFRIRLFQSDILQIMPHKGLLIMNSHSKLWRSVSLSIWMPPLLFTNPNHQLSQSLSNYFYLPLGTLPRLSSNQPSTVTIWYYLVASNLWVMESQKLGVERGCQRSLGPMFLPCWKPCSNFPDKSSLSHLNAFR